MDIPFDLLRIVASYLVKPKMKLLDWIDVNKLNWEQLSSNLNANDLLEAHPNKIWWDVLSGNPNALNLLETVALDPDKINWTSLTFNPSIFEINKPQYKTDITEKANIIDNILYKN